MMSSILLPPYYVIEPTDICNFRCSICPHSQEWNNTQHGIMDLSLFKRIVSQIADSASVIQLYWMGEPLLNPNIIEMIAFCKQTTKAKVIISTNGSLLSHSIVTKLVDSGLDELIISVDACDKQEIYSQIRIGGNLAQLNSNIEYLLSNKGDLHVVLQFIDMYLNKTEKEPFLRKWGGKQCDIDISCLYSWSNQLPWLNSLSDNLSPVRNKQRIPCADLWKKMVIHWNGDISICCFDFENKIFLGNCKETSFVDIWNNEIISKQRIDQREGVYDERLCRYCDSWAEPFEYEEMYHIEKR